VLALSEKRITQQGKGSRRTGEAAVVSKGLLFNLQRFSFPQSKRFQIKPDFAFICSPKFANEVDFDRREW